MVKYLDCLFLTEYKFAKNLCFLFMFFDIFKCVHLNNEVMNKEETYGVMSSIVAVIVAVAREITGNIVII